MLETASAAGQRPAHYPVAISTLGRTLVVEPSGVKCREACRAVSCFSSPPPPRRRSLSLHHPRACNGALNTRQPPSASLHSPSPPPLQRPRFSVSPKTSPGLCSVLTPHTSSVPALPGLIRHRLLVRVHSSHDSLDLTPPCTLSIPLPPSVDLSSSLTAELLDWTTSPHLLRLPPPLSHDCCIHRTAYKASRASVFNTQKGKSISHVVCPLEPCPKRTSDPGLELDLDTPVSGYGKNSSNKHQ